MSSVTKLQTGTTTSFIENSQHATEFDEVRMAYPSIHLETQALYAFPKEVLSLINSSDLFDDRQKAVENKWSKICFDKYHIGIRIYNRTTNHITYDALNPTLMKSIHEGESDQFDAQSYNRIVDIANAKILKAQERVLGVAGRLVTLPDFMNEICTLKKLYLKAEDSNTISWPLQRALIAAPTGEILQPASSTTADFSRALSTFLDRWGLISLLDWHLPVPQGPLLPNYLKPGDPAFPKHCIHHSIPLHYPLQNNDDLLREIQEMQAQEMIKLKIPSDLAGLRNYKQYANLFRIIHCEHIFRSRWGGNLPHRAVSLLENAATAYLDLSLDSIQLQRKWITSLQSGKRKMLTRKG